MRIRRNLKKQGHLSCGTDLPAFSLRPRPSDRRTVRLAPPVSALRTPALHQERLHLLAPLDRPGRRRPGTAPSAVTVRRVVATVDAGHAADAASRHRSSQSVGSPRSRSAVCRVRRRGIADQVGDVQQQREPGARSCSKPESTPPSNAAGAVQALGRRINTVRTTSLLAAPHRSRHHLITVNVCLAPPHHAEHTPHRPRILPSCRSSRPTLPHSH